MSVRKIGSCTHLRAKNMTKYAFRSFFIASENVSKL